VIACPPDTDKAALMMDVWSSLRAPSDSSAMTVLGAGNAALAAIDIIAPSEPELMAMLIGYKTGITRKIEEADAKMRASSA
jgi:phosphoribosylcarboxyaminoimidazole (NCAIR) mutase